MNDDHTSPRATIARSLRDFLIWERLIVDDTEFAAVCEVIDHLEACLNSYGDDGPSDGEAIARTAAAAGAFCDRCGPERIIANLPFFLDYYVIRNVVTSEEVLGAAGRTVAALAMWLGDNGFAQPELARIVSRQGAAAAEDLPRAERMATLLTEHVLRNAVPPPEALVEPVEGFLIITRIEGDALWLDDIGPVRVGRDIADLGRAGWVVSIVLAHIDGAWHVQDVGNVYPRSNPGLDC